MDNLCYTFAEIPFDITMNSELCDVIFYVAGIDSDFSEIYGLTEYAGFEPLYPEKREMSVFSSYQSGTRTPVPQSMTEMLETSYKNEILLSRSGNVISSNNGERFSYNENFRYTYLPDGFFNNNENKKAVDILGGVENYYEMLQSAYDIIDRKIDEISVSDENYERLNHYWYVLDTNLLYVTFEKTLLDYGNNEKIYNLAHEITEGLDSDYDKAKALEWYFIQNGYVYDLDYRKEVGDNAEDFLFNTKTGVCYEYATAMTLLARAVGIPARYCEGFNMQTKYNLDKEEDDLYVVTAKDAHGFPELYIKGFGWVSFEPTMTSSVMQTSENERQAMSSLSKMGIILMIVCASALLLMLIMPVLIHKFFIFANNRRNPNKAVVAVINRICRLYGISASNTAHEAEKAVKSITGIDISGIALLFEKAEYGGAELTETDRENAMKEYVSAYDALKELRKVSRKQKHIRNK
ncbi:MAG: transglutaminase-like domain-containing protein [Ruminococcus sp.]|nr:transglutaminase-like domain-containing protein [Ruminococcus sp.]